MPGIYDKTVAQNNNACLNVINKEYFGLLKDDKKKALVKTILKTIKELNYLEKHNKYRDLDMRILEQYAGLLALTIKEADTLFPPVWQVKNEFLQDQKIIESDKKIADQGFKTDMLLAHYRNFTHGLVRQLSRKFCDFSFQYEETALDRIKLNVQIDQAPFRQSFDALEWQEQEF